MVITIENVLSAQELEAVRQQLATAEFVDGRASAGQSIHHLKNNLQMRRGSGDPIDLDRFIVGALFAKSHVCRSCDAKAVSYSGV